MSIKSLYTGFLFIASRLQRPHLARIVDQASLYFGDDELLTDVPKHSGTVRLDEHDIHDGGYHFSGHVNVLCTGCGKSGRSRCAEFPVIGSLIVS